MDFSPIIIFIFTILLSMTPLIEIRGALPIAMSTSLWSTNALNFTTSLIACIIGGVLVCFISVAIFLPLKKYLKKYRLFNKIFAFTDRKVESYLSAYIDRKMQKKSKKIQKNKKKPQKNAILEQKTENVTFAPTQKNNKKNAKNKMVKIGIVFVFCAIPGPFSGVWTSSALCSILNLDYFSSVFTLALANLASCLIVGIICAVFAEFINIGLVIIAIITILIVIYSFIKFCFSKKQKIA